MQRVATEVVRALDAQRPAGRWVLLCPPRARALPIGHIEQRFIGPAGLPAHLWEQLVLPWAARDGWLVSLAGGAPAFARRDFALLHDAAVFDHPEAYTRPFVAWYRWLFRHLARRGTRLMTVSAFSRQRLALHLGVAEDRMAVLPPGADHLESLTPDFGVLDRLGLRDRPFLLAVGSANPTKNLDRLARAWAALGPGAPALVLVGGRNERVFGGAGMPPGPLQVGPVPDTQLVALYRRALALVFPSIYEGFGLPPLEAMACGCPVVASRASAVREACGEAALYVDAADTQALRDVLGRVQSDAALRARLREAGLARADERRWSTAATSLRAALAAHQGGMAAG